VKFKIEFKLKLARPKQKIVKKKRKRNYKKGNYLPSQSPPIRPINSAQDQAGLGTASGGKEEEVFFFLSPVVDSTQASATSPGRRCGPSSISVDSSSLS
jgi:hypothetical protein